MINLSNFKKIGNEIFVYKNFIDLDTLLLLNNLLDKKKDSDWIEFGNKMYRTDSIKELEPVRKKIISLLDKDYFVGPPTNFVKLLDGATWGEHSDDHDYKNKINNYLEYDGAGEYEFIDYPMLGLVIYFNNFIGGQIHYTSQNIIYAPEPGDLVIHSAKDICIHKVQPVIKGPRYSYSNNIYKKIKIEKSS